MATNNWIDFSGTGQWDSAANWSLGEVPTSADDVVFQSGTVGTSYTVSGNGTAAELNVLGDDVTFTNTLTLGAIANVMGGGTIALSASARLNDLDSDVYIGDDEGATRSSGTFVVNGQAAAQDFFIGSDGAGTADVSGSGALLSASDAFYVGEGPARATLTVSAGGEVSAQGTFYVGATPFDSGQAPAVATVTGEKSTLSAQALIIGGPTEGSLALQSGATATTTTTTINSLGLLQIDDTSSLSGAITIDGGTLSAVAEPEGGQAGPGIVTLSNNITVNSAGATLEGSAPPLDLTGALGGSGPITINGGTVELSAAGTLTGGISIASGTLALGAAGAAGSGAITFTGSGATLQVDGTALPGGQLANTIAFSGTDVLDLPNLAYAVGGSAHVSGSTLTVTSDGVSDSFTVSGLTDGPVTVRPDATGGTEAVACFAAGTRILTEHGEVAVEDLRAGDIALTRSAGVTVPARIVWIGQRRIDLTTHPRPGLVRPVRILPGALCDGVPHRPLLLSPDHALLVEGKLVAVRQLVNGGSIAVVDVPVVQYFHIELQRHAILLAEGAEAESYLDTGNRDQFNNAGAVVTLHADFSRAEHKLAVAPLVTDGPSVRPIWERLAARSGRLGFGLRQPLMTRVPELRLQLTCGRSVPADRVHADGRHVFLRHAQDGGIGPVRLRSRHASAADIRPWEDDRRQLGVAVASIRIWTRQAGLVPTTLSLADRAFSAGWWDVEQEGARAWRWTDGDAALLLPADCMRIDVMVAAIAEYLADGRDPGRSLVAWPG